jgi:hypothetical protein
LTVTKYPEADRIRFAIDGKTFTSYVFGDADAPRPYFYPLIGPGDQPLTRRFPMDATVLDEPTDHPHHRSLWSGHGDVNGHDNWNAAPGHAITRFRRLEDGTPDDSLVTYSDYLDTSGNLLCQEKIAIKIVPLENDSVLIDWQVTLTSPDDAPTKLGDTKEVGLCAVRVAAPLQGDRGGQIENAEGSLGEAECWGKPSRWCDYYGEPSSGNGTVGIAILSHPETFRHPTHWHVRNYGLFSANPFGLSAFTKGAENGEATLEPGQSLSFHYAVVTHRGTAQDADLEAIWQQWATA